MVINKRLKAFKKRIPRSRMLRRVGVDTSRVLRTGGTSALMWGMEALGVPPSTLQLQRRAAAAAAHPGDSMCGQDLDLALILADGSAKGMADPGLRRTHWADGALGNGCVGRLATGAITQLNDAGGDGGVPEG
jgi:hypothetical protein